jgi:hypothetical protein
MPGNGHIGGGGSCWLDFTVNDKPVPTQWNAYDKGSDVGKCNVTVKFPKHSNIQVVNGNEITVDLRMGTTVEIKWT